VIPLNLSVLERELKAHSALVSIETYESWIGELRRTVGAAQTLLGLIIVLILATTGMTIAYVTRSSLAANRKVIEIMHMVGAQNRYISHQFSRQMAALAAIGGLAGYAASLAVMAVLRRFAGRIGGGIISDFSLPPYVWLYMLAVPVAAVAIAKLTAMATVGRSLDRMV
jgi:cell division transport system permease protein